MRYGSSTFPRGTKRLLFGVAMVFLLKLGYKIRVQISEIKDKEGKIRLSFIQQVFGFCFKMRNKVLQAHAAQVVAAVLAHR